MLDQATRKDQEYDAADDPRRLRPIDPDPEGKPAWPDPTHVDEDEKEAKAHKVGPLPSQLDVRARGLVARARAAHRSHAARPGAFLVLTRFALLPPQDAAAMGDVSINVAGTFWAVMGLVATAFYQLLVSQRQRSLKVNALQLLHYQAPQAAGVVILMTPFLDNMKDLAAFEYVRAAITL